MNSLPFVSTDRLDLDPDRNQNGIGSFSSPEHLIHHVLTKLIHNFLRYHAIYHFWPHLSMMKNHLQNEMIFIEYTVFRLSKVHTQSLQGALCETTLVAVNLYLHRSTLLGSMWSNYILKSLLQSTFINLNNVSFTLVPKCFHNCQGW